MFYIRTADRLERTATWFNKLEGGIDYLRRVVIDDSLGICAQLEAEMARHVATYECESEGDRRGPPSACGASAASSTTTGPTRASSWFPNGANAGPRIDTRRPSPWR
jgi:NAD(P)H-nitrite reductase